MRCPRVTELPPFVGGKTGWPWTEETPPLPDFMPDGSSWTRLSIVTPSFNQGHFIEETIRSVLLQGYPNLEYIIIDGGSTDGAVEIIRKYEPWLAYWVSEPDRGQSHAINKGWMRASGDIVAYLNSDDTLKPEALRRVAEAFTAQPSTAMVYGDCNLVDSEGRFVQRMKARPFDRASLLLVDYIHQSSAFVGRNAVERVGLLDESLLMCMDYDYWVRLAMTGSGMTYIPEVLSSARLTSHTKTASLTLRFLPDAIQVLDSVYNRSDVPDDARHVKRRAYANAWRLGGVRYFDAKMRWSAIKALFRSLWWNPWPGWRPLAVALLLAGQAALGVNWRSAYTYEKALGFQSRSDDRAPSQ
jgi:glycosyltransferase involved in cell wall biosynthesis